MQALDQTMLGDLLVLVKNFDQFDAGTDPFGEHDFGGARLCGAGYLWKIDYYDRTPSHGSPDPADAALTTRVLTVMREDEY